MTDQALTPYLARGTTGAPAPFETPAARESNPATDFMRILGRRWRTIVVTMATVVAVTIAYCLIAAPRYEAEATLLIEPRGPQVLGSQRFGGADDPFASTKYDYYVTQYRLLESPAIAARVIERLGLLTDPRFIGELDLPAGTAPTAATALSHYDHHLAILPVRTTRLVRVGFTSGDPALAAEVANAHARAYVELGIERVYEGMDQVRHFLEAKLQVLHQQMQAAETALMDYQSENRVLPLDLNKDVASERLMDLSRRLTQAQADLIVVEAEYKLAKQGEVAHLPSLLSNSTVQRLREDYNRMELERALLAAKWRPTYPALKQLDAQMAHARALLDAEITKAMAELQARYQQAGATVRRIESEIATQRQALVERKDEEGELLTLTRDAETTRSLYESLIARVKEIDIVGGADISHISIADPATPPRHPSSPRTRFSIVLSVITGLLVGAGIAFLRDGLDRTIKDPRDVERATGLGILAVVPDLNASATTGTLLGAWRGKAANGRTASAAASAADATTGGAVSPSVVLGAGLARPAAEAYRTLRTALLLKKMPTSPRVILFTSAMGTEGKTTTAVNTAAALATCGGSVLLIDGDLRLPRCHDVLGLPYTPGLGEYLGGQLRSQPIQSTSIANLSFVGAGRALQNPTELLTSWRMWQLVRGARERFDFIVIDSPPVLAVSDALLLANLADGVILVVEKKRSREDQAHAAMLRLQEAGATVLGAVLNRGDVGHEYYQYIWPGPADAAADETTEAPLRAEDYPARAEA